MFTNPAVNIHYHNIFIIYIPIYSVINIVSNISNATDQPKRKIFIQTGSNCTKKPKQIFLKYSRNRSL